MLGEWESRKLNSSFLGKKNTRGKSKLTVCSHKIKYCIVKVPAFPVPDFFSSCPPSAIRGCSRYQMLHCSPPYLPCALSCSSACPCHCALALSSSLLPSHKAILMLTASFFPAASPDASHLPCKDKGSSTAHKGSI